MNKIVFPRTYPVTSHTDHIAEGSTFVAVKGMKEDGVRYIESALEAGARKIVLEQGSCLTSGQLQATKRKNAELVFVPSARLALAELSAQAYNHPARSMRIIGITGTKGKTTTAFLIEHMLRSAGYKTALLSTVENRILDQRFDASLTTALPDYLHTFFNVAQSVGVEYVIMEVAAQALTLHRVATLTFDSVIFTNFSVEHAEFYASHADYFKAKCLILNQLTSDGLAVLNADDEAVARLVGRSSSTVFFSIKQSADISGTIHQSDLSALRMETRTAQTTYNITSAALLGEFSASNILAAIAIGEKYAVSDRVIEASFASFKGVPGRLQRFVLPNGAVAIIDNAHTPSSFEAILTAVRPLSGHVIVLFGAGGDRDSLKRPLMGALAAQYADAVFLTTDNPRSEDPSAIINQIKSGINERELHKVLIELDREKAIKGAYALSRPGTLILLLGKGPVEYQHIKDVKIPFSEASILRSL